MQAEQEAGDGDGGRGRPCARESGRVVVQMWYWQRLHALGFPLHSQISKVNSCTLMRDEEPIPLSHDVPLELQDQASFLSPLNRILFEKYLIYLKNVDCCYRC